MGTVQQGRLNFLEVVFVDQSLILQHDELMKVPGEREQTPTSQSPTPPLQKKKKAWKAAASAGPVPLVLDQFLQVKHPLSVHWDSPLLSQQTA